MTFFQKSFTLPPRPRGCHLITPDILSSLPELKTYQTGILHLFIQHTSAALSLNENYDSDVPLDMADALDRVVPEVGSKEAKRDGVRYRHDAEGRDDMPAHVKASLVGSSVSVPVGKGGELLLGTWQGVWLMEFRDGTHRRRVVATIMGEKG